MTSAPSNESAGASTSIANDEIDLRQIANSLYRRRRLILKITSASLILSAFYALIQKPVWKGQFEIVLSNKNTSSSSASQLVQSNPGLANLIGVNGRDNQLETEVKILESPSVLKPVFDFVKDQKTKSGIDVNNFRYPEWVKDSLTIELAKGTSVLELSYRDTDQNLILPVIERISKAYQAYSGRDRERGISLAIEYLDQQINIYRTKSVESLRAAQQFAIDQDLTALNGDGTNDAEIRNAINIEAIRVQAANQIRNINEQLKQLDGLNNNPETLMYVGRNIPELSNQGLPQSLDSIDTQLALLRAKFTDKDDSVRRLVEKRRLLIEVFKRQTYGYLYAQRTSAQARLAAADRPKGVLIRYRELLRTAVRDENTLTKLESERQVLALEKARKQQPWELISTPTLLDKPIAPRKRQILALGLLAGVVIGGSVALVLERRTGLVFSLEELKTLLPYPLLNHLPSESTNELENAARLMASGPLSSNTTTGTIALVPVGAIANDQLDVFASQLRKALGKRELLVSNDPCQTSKCVTQLLLTAPGVATRTQLNHLRQTLALQGTPIAGWIFIDPSLTI